MRPLWRDLILKVWGGDPLLCPCCNGTMKVTGTMIRREEVEFFLRLHGLWQGIIHLPRPPPPFSPSPIPSTAPSSAPRKKQIPRSLSDLPAPARIILEFAQIRPLNRH
ncbi:MAG: hypothetical protein ACI9UA_005013 [Pseudoalteromonas tetraodonis]|jgi:hypothetical protein